MKHVFFAILCCWAVTAGCARPAPIALPTVQLVAGETMGTTYSVKFPQGANLPDLSVVAQAVDTELALVNKQMSTYLPDSEISRFNQERSTEWFSVSLETAQVVELALQVHAWTDGAFDVTVGPLVNLWGFGPQKRPEHVPSQEQIESLLPSIGSDKLEVRLQPPSLRKQHAELQVDLSAIAKGHGVDRVAATLERLGLENYFVEIGGEVRTRGLRPDGRAWQVGIEIPNEERRELNRVVGLSDRSLATSGNYRNLYELDGERFSHTIDPASGRPSRDSIASASVFSEQSCAVADAIATGLMSAGFDKGLQLAEKHAWAVLLVRYEQQGFVQATSSSFRQWYPESSSSPDPVR